MFPMTYDELGRIVGGVPTAVELPDALDVRFRTHPRTARRVHTRPASHVARSPRRRHDHERDGLAEAVLGEGSVDRDLES